MLIGRMNGQVFLGTYMKEKHIFQWEQKLSNIAALLEFVVNMKSIDLWFHKSYIRTEKVILQFTDEVKIG